MGPARFHCATLLSLSVEGTFAKEPVHYTNEGARKVYVRSGIRTHAHRSGLRPERSALDHSAILTTMRYQLTVVRRCLADSYIPLR